MFLLCVKLSQEVGAIHEVTTQHDFRVSSRPENSRDTNQQVSPTELTPRLDPVSSTSPLAHPLKSHPASGIQDVDTEDTAKTQAGMDTQTVGSTNRETNEQKTVSKEVNQGGDLQPVTLYLTGNEELSNAEILGTMKEPWSTESSITTATHSVKTLETAQHSTQVYHPSGAAKKGFTRKETSLLENVETAISSPDIQPENPTAPDLSSGSAVGGTERSFSHGPEYFEFSTRSTHIIGAPTESGFVAPSRYSSSEEEEVRTSTRVVTPPASAAPTVAVSVKVFRATEGNESLERAATEDFAAPQKDPARNLTVLTPTSQSREALSSKDMVAERSNVSVSDINEKEEMEDRLTTVSSETVTTQQQLPGGEQGSGREIDEDEIELGVEEEVETHAEIEMETSNQNIEISEEYNKSSLDWISQFSTEDSSIQSETESSLQNVKAANQPPTYTARHHDAGLRPGIRGQRVR